jgi:hypothetical protein
MIVLKAITYQASESAASVRWTMTRLKRLWATSITNTIKTNPMKTTKNNPHRLKPESDSHTAAGTSTTTTTSSSADTRIEAVQSSSRKNSRRHKRWIASSSSPAIPTSPMKHSINRSLSEDDDTVSVQTQSTDSTSSSKSTTRSTLTPVFNDMVYSDTTFQGHDPSQKKRTWSTLTPVFKDMILEK